MHFIKHRFEIWSPTQHPLKHTLADFSYSNDALPGVTNLEGAFNWLVAVLYPNTQPAVANVAALPAVGNTINDYRVVQDDGDGRAASYRWEQREGEVAASWHKIYDMDWGADSILEAFQLRTQDLYVFRRGYDDLDASGAVVAGLYAGQVVTGGLSANSNLTLRANAGDGVGPRTGYVQFDDQVRPAVDNTFDLGVSSYTFRTLRLGTSAIVNTMTLSTGSIVDSTGAITFDNENLSTTGTLASGTHTISSDLILATGSITSASGAISFGNENLSTTGTITGLSVTGTSNVYVNSAGNLMTLAAGSITSATGAISFDDENLSTTGTLGAGITTVTQLNADNLRLDGNTLSVTNANGNLIVQANGTGVIDFQSAVTSLGITATGVVGVTGQLNVDNLRFDGNVISTTDLNGNLTFTPNGTGTVITSAKFLPGADNSLDLGATASRFQSLYLSTGISDGTTSITQSTLQSLRDINSGVGVGMTLFWSGTQWLASTPDTEVDHGSISGLADDDHTQYALLAGRAGGQTLTGGTAASENLTLESTAHATKGSISMKSNVIPFTNASYSGGWSGTDIGGSSNYWKDVYTKGEFVGFRMQNLTVGTLPSPSTQNIGRVVFATDNNKAYVDIGTSYKVMGIAKSVTDTSWNGSDLTKNVTVSSDVSDARNCLWQLRDNANDFEILGVKITTPNATTVTITTTIALPVGTYRLIGAE